MDMTPELSVARQQDVLGQVIDQNPSLRGSELDKAYAAALSHVVGSQVPANLVTRVREDADPDGALKNSLDPDEQYATITAFILSGGHMPDANLVKQYTSKIHEARTRFFPDVKSPDSDSLYTEIINLAFPNRVDRVSLTMVTSVRELLAKKAGVPAETCMRIHQLVMNEIEAAAA